MSISRITTCPIGRVAAPLREQVLGIVRQAILDFELRPGQRLVERELVDHLEASRTTVREVLARLAAEGLVTMVLQKDAIVSVQSHEDAADIYEMRAALEVLVVRRFIVRAPDDQFEALVERLHEVEQSATEASAPVEELRAKDRFYEVLLAGASSPPLDPGRVGAPGAGAGPACHVVVDAQAVRGAAAEIRRVVEAMIARDVERAFRECVAHIRNAAETGLAAADHETVEKEGADP